MMPRLLTPVSRLASSLLRSSGRKFNGAFSFYISQSVNGSIPRRGTPNFDPQRNFEAPQAAIVLVPKLARRRFQHMRDASCCHPSPLIHTAAKTVSLMNALVCQTSTEFKTEYNEARRSQPQPRQVTGTGTRDVLTHSEPEFLEPAVRKFQHGALSGHIPRSARPAQPNQRSIEDFEEDTAGLRNNTSCTAIQL